MVHLFHRLYGVDAPAQLYSKHKVLHNAILSAHKTQKKNFRCHAKWQGGGLVLIWQN